MLKFVLSLAKHSNWPHAQMEPDVDSCETRRQVPDRLLVALQREHVLDVRS